MTSIVRHVFHSIFLLTGAVSALTLSATAARAQSPGAESDWPYWGGTRHFQRYLPANQVDAGNVEIVWRRPAADPSITDADPQLRISGNFRATPVCAETFSLVSTSPIGEFGADTWTDDSWRGAGDLGSWCCLSADEELGHVYVPFTAPTTAYFGGHRPGDNMYSNSLVAIDASTGERVWHFQMVHHDVWEYDNVGPPELGDIVVDGRPIKAVMQANKTGWVYVFDRVTGEPVWPIKELPVPQSDIPGEVLSPTQPFPTKPAPIATQGITQADIVDFPEVARATVANFVIGPIFTPPSIVSDEPGGNQGTLTLPGSWGSANWNTGAFDPETGWYCGFANDIPRVYRLVATDDPDTDMPYWSPNREAPYPDGIPLTKPPWGRITATDMNSGEHVWQIANGDSLSDHPNLDELDLPTLGIASRPAALVTRTLLFIGVGSNNHGGTQPNMWGTAFRAYDKFTSEEVWRTDLPSGTTGAPMSYMHEGRQHIVVAVGSLSDEPELVALGLR